MAKGSGGAVGSSHGSSKSLSGSRVSGGGRGGAVSVKGAATRMAAAKSNGSRANIVPIPTSK